MKRLFNLSRLLVFLLVQDCIINDLDSTAASLPRIQVSASDDVLSTSPQSSTPSSDAAMSLGGGAVRAAQAGRRVAAAQGSFTRQELVSNNLQNIARQAAAVSAAAAAGTGGFIAGTVASPVVGAVAGGALVGRFAGKNNELAGAAPVMAGVAGGAVAGAVVAPVVGVGAGVAAGRAAYRSTLRAIPPVARSEARVARSARAAERDSQAEPFLGFGDDPRLSARQEAIALARREQAVHRDQFAQERAATEDRIAADFADQPSVSSSSSAGGRPRTPSTSSLPGQIAPVPASRPLVSPDRRLGRRKGKP